ncbi:hypothetical protein RF11_15120 [Thelohanellus kitauei]|uniref:Uncharacterized protein n=1 Tax=Thelohanellus kitauei TaxID=669202 RepID=A0A0C2N244_THEKT|nr:hypothetical protein RF11_15120 [Thelohanellus kitauei]
MRHKLAFVSSEEKDITRLPVLKLSKIFQIIDKDTTQEIESVYLRSEQRSGIGISSEGIAKIRTKRTLYSNKRIQRPESDPYNTRNKLGNFNKNITTHWRENLFHHTKEASEYTNAFHSPMITTPIKSLSYKHQETKNGDETTNLLSIKRHQTTKTQAESSQNYKKDIQTSIDISEQDLLTNTQEIVAPSENKESSNHESTITSKGVTLSHNIGTYLTQNIPENQYKTSHKIIGPKKYMIRRSASILTETEDTLSQVTKNKGSNKNEHLSQKDKFSSKPNEKQVFSTNSVESNKRQITDRYTNVGSVHRKGATSKKCSSSNFASEIDIGIYAFIGGCVLLIALLKLKQQLRPPQINN